MKLLPFVTTLLLSFNSFASSWDFSSYNNRREYEVCLATHQCMEHNGEIIDLRSPITKMYHDTFKCDYQTGSCANNIPLYSQLSPDNVSKILSTTKEKSYFIPLSISQSDALLLLGSLSLGTIVFANDRQIMDFVQSNKSEKTEAVASVANLFGREAIIPIVAGAYFMGAVMEDGKLKQVGLFAVTTGLATQLVTEVFKNSFQRVRPNGTDSPYDFGHPGNNSFFSGHTSGAFSLATVIAETYKDNPVIPFLAYGVATLTAYARMHDQKHWASDVLAGAVVGHLVTKTMMRTWKNKNMSGGFVITPMIGSHYGINISYTPKHPNSSSLKCSKSNSQGRDKLQECFSEIFERASI